MERTETTEKKLTTPSTEVLEKPVRRRFTAQYKLWILAEKMARLERENERLKTKLRQAELVIDVQKKSPRCWRSP